MPDAYAVFAGNPDKHQYLKTAWPELYEALKQAVTPATPRYRPCELLSRHPDTPNARPPAVGRIHPTGPAACQDCLYHLCPSPRGGYPLTITDPRKAR